MLRGFGPNVPRRSGMDPRQPSTENHLQLLLSEPRPQLVSGQGDSILVPIVAASHRVSLTGRPPIPGLKVNLGEKVMSRQLMPIGLMILWRPSGRFSVVQ